jgi:hypothetical protein
MEKLTMTKDICTVGLPTTQKEKRVKANYMEQMNPHVAGVDVGSRSHFVAAPVISKETHEIVIKEFASFTQIYRL